MALSAYMKWPLRGPAELEAGLICDLNDAFSLSHERRATKLVARAANGKPFQALGLQC